MSEERLRKDINRLKQLTNGCIPEYHQDIEDVLDRLEQYKSVLDEIREYITKDLDEPGPEEYQEYTVDISWFNDLLQILDKVKE